MFRWIEHTAELELEIEAPSEAAVFEDALAAIAELLGAAGGDTVEKEIGAEGEEAAMLLVGWLEELIYLAETEGFMPQRIASLDLRKTSLRARVEGRRGEPSHLVKAVTLHRLELRPRDGGWRGRVVLDV